MKKIDHQEVKFGLQHHHIYFLREKRKQQKLKHLMYENKGESYEYYK